jgi:hypothetical protein
MSGYAIHAADIFLDTLGAEKYVHTQLESMESLKVTTSGLDVSPVVAFLKRNIYRHFVVTFNAHDNG